MANSRPTSMLNASNSLSDETISNGSKNITQNKESCPVRSSTQQKPPTNHIINANSSSSSIDSAGAKINTFIETKTSSQVNSNTTVSWTTTDSDLESEQDDRYNNDNNSLDSNSIPIPIQRQQDLSRPDNGQNKSDSNSQEQLSRRVKNFQKLFKSEIRDDMPELIDSYVCAYQGDILLQGKMYITDRYLCFHSRIISYVTKHVYRWEQIDNVTKERVAFIFPTAIGIQLKSSGKKVIYASFLQRDQAFDKIISMCSRFNNDASSLQDDDDNRSTQTGTLKAINSNFGYNEKIKKQKRDIPFDMVDEPEQEDVLQMCLTPNTTTDGTSTSKRRVQTSSSKPSDNKQIKQSKKLFNSDKNKYKSSITSQTVQRSSADNNSENNESSRNSNSNNSPEKETTIKSDDISTTLYPAQNGPIDRSRSCSRTRTSPAQTPSNVSSTTSLINSSMTQNSLLINSNNDGTLGKYSRIIILSVISIIKIIVAYLLLFFNRLKAYPVKTSLILLICITILVIHSFYLISLAYRIESRLQSLHSLWPSSTFIKNSRHL